jgi:hypothetical protein
MDVRRAQLLLGRSNLNTTQTYSQFKDEDGKMCTIMWHFDVRYTQVYLQFKNDK